MNKYFLKRKPLEKSMKVELDLFNYATIPISKSNDT